MQRNDAFGGLFGRGGGGREMVPHAEPGPALVWGDLHRMSSYQRGPTKPRGRQVGGKNRATARSGFARSPRRLELIGGTGGLVMIGLGTTLAFTGRKD